jgi:hypothetical protein
MSVSSVTSNDLLYQTLCPANDTTTSAQNTANSQGTQDASKFSQILQSLGTDLQSGNVQTAQQDLAQLQQALQGIKSAKGHHHHHHSPTSGNSQIANVGQATSLQGTTTIASNVLSTAVGGISPQAITTAS